MDTPCVSVIIPTYNSQDFIGRALDSVLAQSYKDYEILVGDDGSTDQTVEIVQRYQKQHPCISLMHWDKNSGSAVARNNLINKAKGKYIAFLDSDDEWLPTKLDLQIKKLEELSDDWGCIYSGAIIYKEYNNTKEKITFVPHGYGNVYKDLAIGKLSFVTATFIVRKQCLEKVGLFDPELLRHQDADLFLRLLHEYKLALVDEPLSVIHLTMGKKLASRSLSSKKRFLLKNNQIFRKELGIWSYRYINGCCWLNVSADFFLEREVLKGLRYLFKAIVMTPFLPIRLYGRLLKALIKSLKVKD